MTYPRVLFWSLFATLAVTLIWLELHPAAMHHGAVPFAQLKQVALSLRLYADDHQGLLPQRLEELAPTYLAKPELLEGVQLVAPGAKLPEFVPSSVSAAEPDKGLASLPPKAIIARKQFPGGLLIGDLYADMSVKAR